VLHAPKMVMNIGGKERHRGRPQGSPS